MVDGNQGNGGNPQQGGGGNGGGKRRRRRRRGGGGGGPKPQGEGAAPGNERQAQPEGRSPGRPDRPERAPRPDRPDRPQQDKERGDRGPRGDRNRSRGDKRGGRNDRDRSDRGDRGGSADGQTDRNDLRIPRKDRPDRPETPFKHVSRRYGLVIYDSLAAAKAQIEEIKGKLQEFDQLNIVLRAEGGMDDPELSQLGNVKVFAGAAWTLIHERRMADGWYNEPR